MKITEGRLRRKFKLISYGSNCSIPYTWACPNPRPNRIRILWLGPIRSIFQIELVSVEATRYQLPDPDWVEPRSHEIEHSKVRCPLRVIVPSWFEIRFWLYGWPRASLRVLLWSRRQSTGGPTPKEFTTKGRKTDQTSCLRIFVAKPMVGSNKQQSFSNRWRQGTDDHALGRGIGARARIDDP